MKKWEASFNKTWPCGGLPVVGTFDTEQEAHDCIVDLCKIHFAGKWEKYNDTQYAHVAHRGAETCLGYVAKRYILNDDQNARIEVIEQEIKLLNAKIHAIREE